MALSHLLSCFLICTFSFFFLVLLIGGAAENPIELVDNVCNQTSNPTFCADALNSDPRTPHADPYTLAYVSFGLAYLNATSTQHRISKLLHNSSAEQHAPLKRCSWDYRRAVSALEQSFNDLNSETFFTLSGLASRASRAADDCQAAYPNKNPLATMNRNLKALCEICVAVSKLLTG